MADIIKKSDGYYINYSVLLRVRLLNKHKFCALDKLLDFINLYEYRKFYDESNRESVRLHFKELQIEAPFCYNIRFPDDFYVDMDSTNIKAATEQFMDALNSLDLLQLKTMNNLSDNAIRMDYFTTAAQSCKEILRNLGKMVKSTDSNYLKQNGVYCRDIFEATYGLRWTAIACK